jgi:hypothetical protein
MFPAVTYPLVCYYLLLFTYCALSVVSVPKAGKRLWAP